MVLTREAGKAARYRLSRPQGAASEPTIREVAIASLHQADQDKTEMPHVVQRADSGSDTCRRIANWTSSWMP
jgi:hypothetical protein